MMPVLRLSGIGISNYSLHWRLFLCYDFSEQLRLEGGVTIVVRNLYTTEQGG